MRIENWSAFHPTKRLLPLIAYVEERCSCTALATLFLHDAEKGVYSSGLAEKFGPPDTEAPSHITLTLGQGTKYPCRNCYVPEVGEIEWRSWEEEFLFVLAHEARHIDQLFAPDPLVSEEDAERFALKTLKEFRKTRRKIERIRYRARRD